MQYVMAKTRCRLCGQLFEEPLCIDAEGQAWPASYSPSVEDGNPWCAACLDRVNEACDRLCELLDRGLSEGPKHAGLRPVQWPRHGLARTGGPPARAAGRRRTDERS